MALRGIVGVRLCILDTSTPSIGEILSPPTAPLRCLDDGEKASMLETLWGHADHALGGREWEKVEPFSTSSIEEILSPPTAPLRWLDRGEKASM